MPQVSVVIPVFNAARVISAALRSVFAQTFSDFEVIVVDDGSEDLPELTATLAAFEGRIQYLRQPNGGPAKARNTGIAHATGNLVAFLDADDEWQPEKLARQVEYFSRYPETGLLHTGVIDGTGDGNAVDGPPRHAFCDLYHTRFDINTLTVMMPRRVLIDAGGFDERREVHVEDWDLWLRVAAHHPIGFISTPLAYHRPGGLMSSQIDRTYVAQTLVMEKNRELCAQACAQHRAAPARCERMRRHVLHRAWAHSRLEAGDRAGARAQLRLALARSPLDGWSLRMYLASFASEQWRARLRRLVKTRPTEAAKLSTLPSLPKRAKPVSLVHDTIYRRTRRELISRMNDVEDAVSRKTQRRKRVMFEAASPMSFAIFRPLYERLKNDPRIELWFTSYGTVWEPNQIFYSHGVTENVVSPATATWLKVDAYVNADFWDMTWLRRRTRRIHLFHGVAGKYELDAPIDLAPAIAGFDSLLFVNADRREKYVQAGLVPDDEFRAPLVGYPKLDRLVDGSFDRGGIARTLALDSDVPTIIYAPTWSPYSSLHTMGIEIVERLAAEGLQVIVKLHDRSYDLRERGSGGIDWAARLAVYDGHPRVRIARDSDSCPFLVVADAMVSDHSSIAFEYMLLDRPIVIVDRPSLIERANVSQDKVARLRSAAAVVQDPKAVCAAILESLQSPHQRSTERQRTASELFYKPGTATDRALAIVYRLLELSIPSPVRPAQEAAQYLAAAG